MAGLTLETVRSVSLWKSFDFAGAPFAYYGLLLGFDLFGNYKDSSNAHYISLSFSALGFAVAMFVMSFCLLAGRFYGRLWLPLVLGGFCLSMLLSIWGEAPELVVLPIIGSLLFVAWSSSR